jgi:5'-3' exonuclease
MLFNKEYRALIAGTVNEAIGDIFIDVDLQNITEAEYYYVYVSGNDGPWALTDITTTANPADTDLKSLEGVKNLYLGEIISDSEVDEKLVISKEESQFNLCMQLLVGDGVDNIRGLIGCGESTAKMALNRFREEGIDLLDGVMFAYVKGLDKPYSNRKIVPLNFPYSLENFILNYKLVKLLKTTDLHFYSFNEEKVVEQIKQSVRIVENNF